VIESRLKSVAHLSWRAMTYRVRGKGTRSITLRMLLHPCLPLALALTPGV
jgi:hypothetical protein